MERAWLLGTTRTFLNIVSSQESSKRNLYATVDGNFVKSVSQEVGPGLAIDPTGFRNLLTSTQKTNHIKKHGSVFAQFWRLPYFLTPKLNMFKATGVDEVHGIWLVRVCKRC